MTPSQPNSATDGRRLTAEPAPRLRLKPRALPTGYVDGAWWPRSDHLTAELPPLLSVLSSRLGEIASIAYPRREWTRAPAGIMAGDRLVRLSGSRRQPRNTVEILGLSGTSIMLLVVPPRTETGQACAAMIAAAAPSDSSTTAGLLMRRPM